MSAREAMPSRRRLERSAPRAVLLGLLLAACAARAADEPRPLDLRPTPPGHGAETRCERCHTTERWGDVAFAHERTGFPLAGEHRKVGCRQCHPAGFDRPVSHACEACHRDAHRGQLGAGCRGCHDERSWRSRFDADAHRRAGFPLSGRHAFVACEECHGDARDRGFARLVKACADCHARDLARAQVALDHTPFGDDCKACHAPWRFAGGAYPAHEQCFAIASGPHAGVSCRRCHAGAVPRTLAACTTPPLACTACHFGASCPGGHPAVLGMDATACTPAGQLKCYQCHRFAVAPGARGGARRLR